MNLISYAQNHEDIIIWRALKHIKNGFYVDVGASDPQEDSVTQLFYEHDWSGINIEPSLKSYQKLVQERPRDLNLSCAVSSNEGKIKFYDVPTRGWSTSNPEVGEFHRLNHENVIIREVESLTLNSILERNHKGCIHFLKIDVEGAEENVLDSIDLSKFRPWIILIESLSPINQNLSHEKWETKVLKSGYKFVYFDGLNRFYVAKDFVEYAKASSRASLSSTWIAAWCPKHGCAPSSSSSLLLMHHRFRPQDVDSLVFHKRLGPSCP